MVEPNDLSLTNNNYVNLRNNARYLQRFVNQPTSFLEIGVFEAGGTCWILNNVLLHPESRYVGIDNWGVTPTTPNKNAWWLAVKDRAYNNLHLIDSPKCEIIEATSPTALLSLRRQEKRFDVVYIDGNHGYSGCLLDTVLAWDITKTMIIWDDYGSKECRVKEAVVEFLAGVPNEEYCELFRNYQYGVLKTKSTKYL